MALADVLRERVSRRGRTAEVACGLLGTVTVEALPPRECAALGLRDGGRALLYAACRDLQTRPGRRCAGRGGCSPLPR